MVRVHNSLLRDSKSRYVLVTDGEEISASLCYYYLHLFAQETVPKIN